MAQIDRVYARHIRRHMDLHSSWPPSKQLALGDYGEWKGGTFNRVGNVADRFNLSFRTGRAGSAGQIQAITKASFAVRAAAEVKAGDARGDIELHFKKRNEVYFVASGITHRQITDLDRLGDHVVELVERKRWLRRKYLIVTEVVEARHFLAAVSTRSNGTVTLSGSGEVEGVNIDISRFRIKFSSSGVATFEDHNGGTPLFQLHTLTGMGRRRRLTEFR